MTKETSKRKIYPQMRAYQESFLTGNLHTLATSLIGQLFSLGGPIVILYLPLLMALLMARKSNFTPLNLIHISLLISVIVRDTMQMCLLTIYLPSIFWNCTCSPIIGTLLFFLREVVSKSTNQSRLPVFQYFNFW